VTAGVIGNALVLTEAATGIAVSGSGTLASGVNGTVGEMGNMKYDATYLYVCVADNDITGKNWRKVALA